MKYRFGFIGAGHMGGALAVAAAKLVPGEKIIISDTNISRAGALADQIGCAVGSAVDVARESQYLFIGVKPQNIQELFAEIGGVITEKGNRTIVVTMCAGVTIGRLWQLTGNEFPVIRIMPNTPVAVGEGCILYASAGGVSQEEIDEFLGDMGAAGSFLPMNENLIDAASAVSGCGPAFVYKFIMALEEAGVSLGLPEGVARILAEQTVLGSAKLAIESGEAPAELCDHVCSPGGSTIEGVKVLDGSAFSKSLLSAVEASYKRTVELGKS